MRVLITGAPGWLGNRFLEILVNGWEGKGPLNNWDLRCLVMEGIDTSFLRDLAKSKPVECVTGDITRPASLKKALQDVNLVFHIAGLIHPKRIRDVYTINTEGTRNVLQASLDAGVKRFIHISSNSVAGVNGSRDRLMTETDPERPYLNYGISKSLAEKAVRNAQASGRIETVILRPCWYYGPNQPLRQTTFFKMIKKGDPLIFGDGSALRSMSYVDNTSQALLLAAEKPQAGGQTYWIADERPYTSGEIYQTVAELLEVKNYRPRHVPDFVSEACLAADQGLQAMGLYIKEIHVAGEMNKTIACSIEKAQKELGYRPAVALREGMRRSIAWCRAHGVEI